MLCISNLSILLLPSLKELLYLQNWFCKEKPVKTNFPPKQEIYLIQITLLSQVTVDQNRFWGVCFGF